MATFGYQKDEGLLDSSGTVLHQHSSSEDVFDSDSDDDEIVNMTFVVSFVFKREICMKIFKLLLTLVELVEVFKYLYII